VRGDKRDSLGRCVSVKCVHRLLGDVGDDGDGWTDQRRSYVTAARWNVQFAAVRCWCCRRQSTAADAAGTWQIPRTRADAAVLNLASVSLQRELVGGLARSQEESTRRCLWLWFHPVYLYLATLFGMLYPTTLEIQLFPLMSSEAI